MGLGPALIGAGANLLGGILSKPRAKDNFWGTEAGIHAQIKYTREHAENFGFNPLAWIGQTQSLGAAPSNSYMGAAVADAGMVLADALAKQKDIGRLERAERLNEKLRQQVTDLTLRPAVPGVYGAPSGIGGGDAAPNRQRSAVPGGDEIAVPSRGDFGNVDPQSRNVAERVRSHEQFTDVPVGPDFDEVVTGVFIDANNRHKARKAFRARTDMTFGDPLRSPGSPFVPNSGGEIPDAYWGGLELLPPAPVKKKRGTMRFDPAHRDAYYWAY